MFITVAAAALSAAQPAPSPAPTPGHGHHGMTGTEMHGPMCKDCKSGDQSSAHEGMAGCCCCCHGEHGDHPAMNDDKAK